MVSCVPDSKRAVINMVFNSLSDAWNFYEEYAIAAGFEPIRSTSKPPRGRSDVVRGLVKLKIFKCAKAGLGVNSNKKVDSLIEKEVDKEHSSVDIEVSNSVHKKVKSRRSYSKKCGCRAEIRLSLNAEKKYVVYRFKEEHNHFLVHPDYMKHLIAFRKVNFSKKCLLYKMSEASVGASAGHRIMTKVSGSEGICFSKTDAKNFRRDVLEYIGDFDCEMVINLLMKRKHSSTDFSFEYFLESDNSLGGFFWADEHSKRNYSAFGDVVSFDATYRTNKYDMVFIPFTGIDNHKKCVTFGAGMLTKENAVSYKWLLHAFSKAFPNHPRMVLTDQDAAMKIAIDEVFKESRHRLCMWHIMEKLNSKVPLAVRNNGFKVKLCRIVWTDKLEPEVFDFLWDSIIEEYDLGDNKWLSDMFALKQYWIPAYFMYWEFSGLMRTSSRSESENSMFNQLMNSSSTLVEFLTHFDTAMNDQRFVQSKNDHQSSYTFPKLVHDWALEKDAARLFTRSVFVDISDEIGYAVKKCMSLAFSEVDGVKKFTIVDSSVVSTEIDYSIDRVKDPKYFDEFFPKQSEVVYNVSVDEITCSCRRYERFGLFCRHIFYVLRICKASKFPSRYVCKRWMKGVVPPKIISNAYNNLSVAQEQMGLGDLIRQVYHNVELALDKVIGNKDKLLKFLKAQENIVKVYEEDFDVADLMSNKQFISEILGVEKPAYVDIHAPSGVRNKGCGTTKKRITTSREKAISKSVSNGRTCGYCGSYDPHNIRTCPKRKEDLLKNADEGCSNSGS